VSTIRYYTVLQVTIRYYTVLQVTIRYYTVLNGTVLYYTVRYVIIRYYTVLYGTTRYYTVLHGTIRYYTVLYVTTRTVKYNTENTTLFSCYLIIHYPTINRHSHIRRSQTVLCNLALGVLCQVRTECHVDLVVFRVLTSLAPPPL